MRFPIRALSNRQVASASRSARTCCATPGQPTTWHRPQRGGIAALVHADIVITCPDVDPVRIGHVLDAFAQENPRLITVDITGAGAFGPLAGMALKETFKCRRCAD